MAEIKKLDSLTASKIAAGEVVDRPVNVVKELTENALDAGATKITVELEGGGSDYIRVTDNGRGIKFEDLPLAIERFATSKISSVEDVYSVSTFGFRGEALAAISSVSHFTIKSIREGDRPGEVAVNYGTAADTRPSPISKGTQITVSKLFDNLPVRKKFLKSPRSSEAEILRFIKHFSMVNAGVEIIAVFDGTEVYRAYPADTMLELAKKVFSEDKVQLGEKVHGTSIKVSVCTTHPSVQRKRRDSIFIGVNGRVIKDPALTQAVVQAYHRVMPPNVYPAAVVDIRIDPSALDVNIHPAKAEVRFEAPSQLFAYVRDATEAALAKFTAAVYAEQEEILNEGQVEAGKKKISEVVMSAQERKDPFMHARPAFDLSREFKSAPVKEQARPDAYAETYQQPPENGAAQPEPADGIQPETEQFIVIGQLADTYILCGTPRGDLMIIDQHVAHERILYEKYRMEKLQALPSMTLFEPVVVKFDDEELLFLPSMADELASFGYSFELFGGKEVKVTRAPVDVLKKDIGKEFSEIIHDAMNLRKSSSQDYAVVVMSCRNAVKAGDKLDRYTMQHLVNALFETQNPHTCPHGRPIIYHLPAADLAKKFNR